MNTTLSQGYSIHLKPDSYRHGDKSVVDTFFRDLYKDRYMEVMKGNCNSMFVNATFETRLEEAWGKKIASSCYMLSAQGKIMSLRYR